MQINSVTRQSGLLSALLLTFIIVATVAGSAVRTNGDYSGTMTWLDPFATSILLLSTGMVVGRMSVKSGIFRSFCTLPIPMFGIVACGAHLDSTTTGIAAAAFCLAVALLLFSESLLATGAKSPIFFGAILLGGTVLLYPPCVVLVLLLPAAALISAQTPRQIIIALTGWLLPIIAVSYVSWYAGNGIFDTVLGIVDGIVVPQPHADFVGLPVIPTAIFSITGMLILAGIVLRQIDRGTMLVNLRKSLQMLAITLVILLAAFALPGCTPAIIPVIAVPAAVLASATLERGRADIATIIYWLLLLLSALNMFVD